MLNKSIFIALCCIANTCIAENAIYKHVDSKGRVTFTDRQHNDNYIKLVKTWKGWEEPQAPQNIVYFKRKILPHLKAAAGKYNVSTDLVKAIIHAESYYNPVAVSRAGAVGLMQLMPATAKRYGVADRRDVKQNIDGGVKYFSELMHMFDNNTTLALAAYNAGENAVKRYGNKIPPYRETQHYVTKVLRLYAQYDSGKITY